MPNKPSWLLRVNDILADLARPELASVPFLSRAAIENLFGLKRRQSIQIMHAVGGFQIGKAFVVARSDLTRWLRRASLGAQVGWEQARYARVEDTIAQVQHEREARRQRAVLPGPTPRTQARQHPPSARRTPHLFPRRPGREGYKRFEALDVEDHGNEL